MVVFTCGNCGESLKKNRVESHFERKCRNGNVVSCIDCGKDFWGDEYQAHTQCISEAEKYSGKNYVPKANANKNVAKQQNWVQNVQSAIDKVQANHTVKNLLERLKDHTNIPRKKAKFDNFLLNSMMIRNPALRSQMWELLMANTEPTVPAPEQKGPQEVSTTNGTSEPKSADQSELKEEKKLSKREKKEQRQKNKNKKEKKDKSVNGDDGESTSEKSHSKKKKRKHSEIEDEESNNCAGSSQSTNGTVKDEEEEEEDEQPKKKRHKTKFDWEGVISEVLSTKGKEMAIKKVRKKVLGEYLAQGCTADTEQKLWAKFDKKIKKNPNFKVLKEKVKLVSS